MGLLSAVGSALGGSGLGSIAAGAASALGSALNYKQGSLNRDFTRDMTERQHQIEVADLKAAGLNPILSSTGGGNVAGGVSTPSVDTTGISSSAIQAARNNAEVDLMRKQAAKVGQDTDNAEIQGRLLDLELARARAQNSAYSLIDSGITGVKGLGKWIGESAAKAQIGASSALDSAGRYIREGNDRVKKIYEGRGVGLSLPFSDNPKDRDTRWSDYRRKK